VRPRPVEAPIAEPATLIDTTLAPSRTDRRTGSMRPPAVCYLGFRTTTDGREYTCRVTDGLGPRTFVLLIPHQAFSSREVRFQDAPDLCFARLQRELVADPDLVPSSLLVLTAQELLEYRNVREHRTSGRKRGGSSGSGTSDDAGNGTSATDT
jgi:hypothetical protein